MLAATGGCDDAKKDAKKDDKAAAKDKKDGKDAKKADGADAKKADGGDAKADGGDAAAADGGGDLIKANAVDWYKEYMAVKGADAMKYMGKKVEVTGKVKKIITEMDESQKVWLVGEGEGWVSLQFTDKGAKVKEMKPAEGSDLTATCGIGGASPGKFVMMVDCEVK
ncbi:MAG: hypothetical protein AAF799_41825 [Myxococcota bacterium]